MTKTRPHIPKATEEKVQDEYNHLCAMCGAIKPQLHHIDENPSNNDALNLLPLCPNCHLTDQHNPTRRIELGILQLFRRHKDPVILSPQFSVLFQRFKYILAIEPPEKYGDLEERKNELVAFIKELKMGEFYSRRIATLLIVPLPVISIQRNNPAEEARAARLQQEATQRYRQQFPEIRTKVIELIMELLKFQDWNSQRE